MKVVATVVALSCLFSVRGASLDFQSGRQEATQQPLTAYVDLGSSEAVLGDVTAAFRFWAQLHDKQYLRDAEEFGKRLATFKENARMVFDHNSAHTTSTLRLNEFADLSFDEFSATRTGYDPALAEGETPAARLESFRYADVSAPASVDWVSKGAVTGVKNQGQCGSCWAFSTTGSIEGINYLKTGKLVPLSEQELVDCDTSKDHGCGGGLMDFAFSYVVKNGGMDTETDYAYWGAFPSFCNRRKQADRHVVTISGYEDVPPNDEDALARAVAHQPISVAICVTPALQFYHSGVFDAKCGTMLNHGVLLVGYGEEEGLPYWKIKNSWGLGWGEQGYFRLKKGLGGAGQCGVTLKASYPVKDNDSNPTTPTICDPQLLSLWECPAHTQCHCDFNLFGLLCLWYSCPPADAVACSDGEHFCPREAPICDAGTERCMSADGELTSAMLVSEPAHKRV